MINGDEKKRTVVVCPNLLCANSDPEIAATTGMIRNFGSYKSKNGKVQRYKCTICGTTFTERTGKANWHMRYDQYNSEEMYSEFLHGMKVSDIAREYNCSQGIVRTRLNCKRRNKISIG